MHPLSRARLPRYHALTQILTENQKNLTQIMMSVLCTARRQLVSLLVVAESYPSPCLHPLSITCCLEPRFKLRVCVVYPLLFYIFWRCTVAFSFGEVMKSMIYRLMDRTFSVLNVDCNSFHYESPLEIMSFMVYCTSIKHK